MILREVIAAAELVTDVSVTADNCTRLGLTEAGAWPPCW
jgi:hypothetical protein